METLRILVQLEDPNFYSNAPYETFGRMQREDPVFWYEPLDTWVLTKYEDIRYVSRTPETFSVASGILLNDAKFGLVSSAFFSPEARSMALLDPPEQRDVRRTIVPQFVPKTIAEMEPEVRRICRGLLDQIEPATMIDWVDKVAVALPLQVIAGLLGISTDHVDQMKFWSDEMLKMGAPLSPSELAEAVANLAPMNVFLTEQLEAKRKAPDDRMLSRLLAATLNDEPLSAARMRTLATSVMVAGNETTRNLLSGSIWAFSQHPDQMRVLVDDPSLSGQAVEELLRWWTPVPAFLRTVQHDTELRGRQLLAGQHVYMIYMAGNRDEEIFTDPNTLDLSRTPDPLHVAFGFGTHVCIGAPLARLEARVLFEELVQRFSSCELAGEPHRVHSALQNGFHSLPVSFTS